MYAIRSYYDPVYTGKAFHGLLSEIERGRFKGARNIIFLHTGGVFGLLAQQSEFHFDRITSYNVCYTKLLRLRSFESARELAGLDMAQP